MPRPSRLGSEIEQAFARDPRFPPDPFGHTEYLLRYRTVTGVPFAVGRTAASGVRLWLSADDRFKAALEAEGFRCTRSLPKPKEEGKVATGRNSNLEQIREFKGAPLYWVQVTSAAEAVRAASKLR